MQVLQHVRHVAAVVPQLVDMHVGFLPVAVMHMQLA